MKLNCLPPPCLPSWVVEPIDWVVRQAASGVRRSHDHGNCAASALLLVMLRPQLFAGGEQGADSIGRMVEWAPLRIFGSPPPHRLMTWDMAPRSGEGTDNFRGNVMEGLSDHLNGLAARSAAAAEAGTCLQDAWALFRSKQEIVARVLGYTAPIPAWQVARAALQVPDIFILR